jgi:hypothetical protein
MNARKSEKVVVAPEKKKRKYNNEPTVINGVTLDSKKEARHYVDLLEWQKSGQITELRHQVPFEITVNGQDICVYIADFTFTKDGAVVVEDVKSKATRKLPVYALKKKLMLAVHGIEIQEV